MLRLIVELASTLAAPQTKLVNWMKKYRRNEVALARSYRGKRKDIALCRTSRAMMMSGRRLDGLARCQVRSSGNKVEGAPGAVFPEHAQELVSQLNQLVPVNTGFLRQSLIAPTTATSQMTRASPGLVIPADLGEVLPSSRGSRHRRHDLSRLHGELRGVCPLPC